MTTIYESAFRNCTSLTSITLGYGISSIGGVAFADCYELTDVYCYAVNVPTTVSNAFEGSYIESATLHVPNASLNAYRTAEPWSGFGNIVANERIIEDLSELSNNKQYIIHTRDKNRGSLGVTEKHLASTNPNAYGPWVCKPVVLDKDNPLITNVSQLSSPYTEPTEGSLDAMIDGNTGSFWHSAWSQGDVEAGSHYFQVEMLNQANIDVAFKVVRRQTDDNHITEWGIYGTNNANATKANCTPLAVIETPYKGWGETRVSDIFKTGGYKYLRFYINNTTTGRGFGHLAEFQLYPATYDEVYGDASPFAIIQKDGGYYLYSVLDKAFITPVNDGDENTNPLLPSDNKMDIYKQEDHFVFSFVETDYTINVNQKGVVINDYGKINDKYDDGNLFTIEEVGVFDPTEALAKFETQIFTVTYNVMYEGNLVATATEQVPSGDALPPAPASIDNGFVSLTKTGTHPTTVTENVTVTYTATWNGPFEFTKTAASAKWYNMHIRSGYYVGKQDTEPYHPTQDVDEATLATPAYQWAFGGNPYHVKVYNRTTGMSETLTKDNDNAVMRSGDYTWDLLPNSDGFVLRVSGTENTCINQIGGANGPLQFWTNDNSPKDNGSTFRVVDVPSPAIEFADDNVEAICVANWDKNGDRKLSEVEAAAVPDLGNVFKGNKTITSFNELQYFTGIDSICSNAFDDCNNLTSVMIPNNVTRICNGAFWSTGLTSVTLPTSVTSIGQDAFNSCQGLTTLTIPGSVTDIYKAAFYNCKNLRSVTFEKGVKYIGRNAFHFCSSLTSISIPNSVTTIDYCAFNGCAMASITIPNSVTSIGGYAFSGNANLKYVTMPASVITFDEKDGHAFGETNNIESVFIYDLTAWLATSFPKGNNPLRSGAKLYLNNVEVKNLVIPEGTTTILDAAFEGCVSLTSVNIHEGVTNINGWAFASCSNLTSVTIAESVTSIGNKVFYNCNGLSDVYCYATSIPATGNDVFTGSPTASATLHVPGSSLNAYRTTVPWSNFGKIWPIDGFVINDETTSFTIEAEGNENVIFTHGFTGDWESLYLPLPIDYDAIKADFDLAEIDGVVQNDENNDGTPDITVLSIIGFKEQTTTPNKPYLIRAKNAGEQTIVFDDVTIYPTVSSSIDCASTSIRYEFTGSYNTLNASALSNRYVVQNGELVKGASKLAPCRWYMTATARNGAPLNLPNKIRIMSVEDVITGVSPLGETEEGAAIYNLAGQRLNKMQKGINITNGKKVFLK